MSGSLTAHPTRQPLGFVEWFRMGQKAHAEDVIAGLKAAGVRYLRTQLSWAEFHMEGGQEWYDWLFPQLGAAFDILPCVHYTPPSLSRTGRCSGAPKRLRDYADFVDFALGRYGEHIEALELWNEPNNLLDWDWRADPDHSLFSEMITDAATWARHRGYRVVLGGPCPFDPLWLDLMGQRGVLALVSAVGLHGFPGTWDSTHGSWRGWKAHLDEMRGVVAHYNPDAEIWITEAGYSTWNHDELEQVRRFRDAMNAPAERLYWYGWRDVPPDVAVQEGLWFDPRHYHLGAVDSQNRPKMLARLLTEGGAERTEEIVSMLAPGQGRRARKPIVITGGSGFIGCNLADSFLADGQDVVIVDNLSRPGVDQNLQWLRRKYGDKVHPHIVDIRQPRGLQEIIRNAQAVFHLAAQTAVTTSLVQPVEDFETNARGTLNVLEAIRASGQNIPIIFASTNKVYGDLADVVLESFSDRYLPGEPVLRAHGVGEDRPLDLCTPYGCSKGVADQYVLDYAKSYGIDSCVVRMSCIYGPHQHGTEDQGWVAHFLLRALAGEEITIFGDGRQIRDILHVSDAVAAYRGLLDHIHAASGQAFNLGGGPGNAVSLNMLIDQIRHLPASDVSVRHDETRTGDQKYFVADTRKLRRLTGWTPAYHWKDGVADLWDWFSERRRHPAIPARHEEVTV